MLAHVHKVLAASLEGDVRDMDPALRVCVQFALAGPHPVSPPEPAAAPSLTVAVLGMHLHAATTVDGRDRPKQTPGASLPREPRLRSGARQSPMSMERIDDLCSSTYLKPEVAQSFETLREPA